MSSEPIVVRPAAPEEADDLSELAFRSKAHWGYSDQFMEDCRDELSVSRQQLCDDDCVCLVAARGPQILGFCLIEPQQPGSYEMEAMFIEPDATRQGAGRTLFEHAISRLVAIGAERLVIQSDPHAAEFYTSVGARQIGSRESGSIPGRALPLFEIDLRDFTAHGE